VAKAAAGHARLLWHSRSLAGALRDERVPEPIKAKLRLVGEVREFAFSRMGLQRTRDYAKYSPVPGPVAYVVSACPFTRLKPYQWWFPVVGKVPYKGYFYEADAVREMRRMQARGYDARVGAASAYNTPLWFSDPIPSAVLYYSDGRLAELIIHELTHAAVWFKGRTDFNESLATFVGEAGARAFITRRFGADSAQMEEYRLDLAREQELGAAMDEIYSRLDALYRRPDSDDDKMAQREEVFVWGRKRLADIGQPLDEPLNNASVLAYRLYHHDLAAFRGLYERNGRDWPKTLAAFKALDRRDPYAALTR
jgi:predicted aminopeptidase